MPELPEVETTRRGLETHALNKKIIKISIRQPLLRWPVPYELLEAEHQTIQKVYRRGKYLLLYTKAGCAIIHLGMSGSLRLESKENPLLKHDHVDILLSHNLCLRFNDPRRFGAFLWIKEDPLEHPLLKNIGPEPLTQDFNANYLYHRTRSINRSIKQVIMDSKIVAGVGNIYAQEALFLAGIHPLCTANKISLYRYEKLVKAITQILKSAIGAGGTTLRNFINSEGKAGYFKQKLKVYGRAGEECFKCKKNLIGIYQQKRNTVYCPHCQTL